VLPGLEPLPVEQTDGRMFYGSGDGEILAAQRHDEPILELGHVNDLAAEFTGDFCPHFGAVKEFKAFAVGGIANDDIVALLAELVGEPLHLIHAVGFMVDGHDQSQSGTESVQHGGEIDQREVVNERIGGRSTTVHDDEAGFFQGGEERIWPLRFVELDEGRFGMEAGERGVFVVAVKDGMGNGLVFEILDEVDGKETFADTAFAVEDEVETFHGLVGVDGV